MYDEATEELGRVVADFGDTPPTTAQALGETGGQHVAQLEKSLTAADPEFSGRVSTARRAAEERARDELAGGAPAASVIGTSESFNAAARTAREKVREAYKNAESTLRSHVSTRGVKAKIQSVLARMSPAKRAALDTSVVTRIKGYGDRIPASHLEDELSQLKAVLRDPNARQQWPATIELIDALDGELDKAIARVNDPALRNARAASRDYHRTYEPQSQMKAARIDSELQVADRVVKALNGRPDAIAKALVRGKGSARPAEVARQVKKALKGDPEALLQVQDAFWQEIVGPALNKNAVQQGLTKMRDPAMRRTYTELFGRKSWDHAERWLKNLQKTRRGTAGMPSASQSTGSSINAQGVIDVAMAGNRERLQKGLGLLMKTFTNKTEVDTILREALLDPKIMRDLLAIPVDLGREAWISRMKTVAARASARNAAINYGLE